MSTGFVVAEWGDPLSDERQAHLKSLGFTPNLPVFRAKIEFTKRDIRDALFKSTYGAPKTLYFSVEEEGRMGDWPLYMLVESARALWHPYSFHTGEVPVGRWPYANWYLEGHLFTSPLDGPSELAVMRAYIDGIEQDTDIQEVCVQLDRFPADVPEETPLRYGIGAPGQPMP